MENNKHQKHHKGEGKNDSNIKLCDLPIDIHHKILSNLPTKEAIGTCVLSKSWLNKWKGINVIDLEESDEPNKRQQFVDFVEKLLVACNTSSLKKFSLLFEVGDETPRLNAWLAVFVNPMIEELSLKLDRVEEPLVLPQHFFTSETLTKFELSMQQVISLPPSTISFKNLVTLTLKNVIFPSNYYTARFFLGLPSLKEITLIDCNWKNAGYIIICCSSLQTVFIREWKDEEEDDDENHGNEEEDHDDQNNHGKIAIYATKLLTFLYDGDMINDYSLIFTTMVTNATIEVHQHHNKKLCACYFMFKLFTALCNVAKLSLTYFAVEALGDQIQILNENLLSFNNLVEFRVVSYSSITNFSSQGLHIILQHSPILEEIEFDGGLVLDENGGDDINPLPACFETHVKIITIYGFQGSEEELNAIKFLLKIGQVLEIIYIFTYEFDFDYPGGPEKLEMLYEQMLGFPKASIDCEIALQ